MPDTKDCFKTHPMLHSLTGLGVGLVLVALFPSLVSNALTWGIIAIVAGVALEFVLLGKKK